MFTTKPLTFILGLQTGRTQAAELNWASMVAPEAILTEPKQCPVSTGQTLHSGTIGIYKKNPQFFLTPLNCSARFHHIYVLISCFLL